SGVHAAVAHLIALGHRRIAYVAGPERYLHARARRAAWCGALAAAGLPAGTWRASDFSAASGATATRDLLAEPEPPTAIVYANDVMAIAGIAIAAECGVSVPERLSVIGFDDIPLAAHVRPALTTVRADPGAWGQAAARTLLTLVETGEVGDVSLDPAVLVVRQSSGPTSTPRRTAVDRRTGLKGQPL
ncbi:MAG: substrate-binding domain-containing protein, partial [Dactylosporangium sp.]|nr:substrate-binding domain-containing protein [Dactylosporangium sp.]NNJ62925.1 substrate-binding domain-containing protein [Dactylosporangium sp.]